MTYEIFYSFGGHSGPYDTLKMAQERARAMLRGMKNPYASIQIKERTAQGIGGYGHTVETIHSSEVRANGGHS